MHLDHHQIPNDPSPKLDNLSSCHPKEKEDVSCFCSNSSSQFLKGYLVVRLHLRRRRFCTLNGRIFSIYHSSSDLLHKVAPRRTYVVAGVKDLEKIDPSTRSALFGSIVYENALYVSVAKSKSFVIEADTSIEKQRWLHAMNTFNCPETCSIQDNIQDTIQDNIQTFMKDVHSNAQVTILLLHKHRNDIKCSSVILDSLASLAQTNINEVEFYLQQIIHIAMHSPQFTITHLSKLLVEICKSKKYKEHLGNSIHIPLQMFWYLEGMIQDKDSTIYNKCVSALMTIEAIVVDQHFDSTRDDITSVFEIPGLQETLLKQLGSLSINNNNINNTMIYPIQSLESTNPLKEQQPKNRRITQPLLTEQQKEHILKWVKQERHKRYQFFQAQRDFIKSLTDISERMRLVEPIRDRKKKLQDELEHLYIPENAFIPLVKASDPCLKVVRVVVKEGIVFSTNTRAPCLIVFEVVEEQETEQLQKQIDGQTDHVGIDDDPEKKDYDDKRNSEIIEKKNPFLKRVKLTHRTNSANSLVEEDNEIVNIIRGKTIDLTDQDDDSEPSFMDNGKGNNDVELHQQLESYSMRRLSILSYGDSLSNLMNVAESFGETWAKKKARIRKKSSHSHLPGWNVISMICKSNDDMRQEVFALQLISRFDEIFKSNNLSLSLRPYRIISTGSSTGLIETITDAQSLDSLKKKGCKNLREHFEKVYGGPSSKSFLQAQNNFLNSLAAYSVVCYLLQIKDRHNGNILIDSTGSLVHIDFGFLLGIAPGGNWSIETAPFKLTKEMVQVLGGPKSELFQKFIHLFTLGLMTAQRNAESITSLIEIMMQNSKFACFQGRDTHRMLKTIQERFKEHSESAETVEFVLNLVKSSYNNKWTKRYDKFQKITNGIMS